MTLSRRPTFAKISLENLRFNFRSSRQFIGCELKYMAVVKANAYGHGAVECSCVLAGEGIDWFGVALAEEALELREAGIKTPILCFGGFFEGQEDELINRSVTPVVFRIDQAESLNRAARRAGKIVNIHVKIDTGFGRVGVRTESVAAFADRLKGFENLNLEGLMTHFAAADDLAEYDFTDLQTRRFFEAVEIFRSAGISPVLTDLANSPGAVAHPNSRGNMVRLGGILYGLGGDVLPAGVPQPELRPVMSLHSELAMVKSVARGESLGYGRTFFTERDSVIATVPIGYHDGYRRGLSNNSVVIVNGSYAPVVGRVSMDWSIIDVTDVPSPRVGDKVVLIGSNDQLYITAEDLAARMGTISYEITCGIGTRVPRVFN